MPKFIYTIIFLSILSWFGLYRYVDTTPPASIDKIIIFLGVMFIAVTLTLSLPVYFYFHAKVPTFSNLRFLYRKSFKWALFTSFGIVFFLGLKAFALDNTLNIILFLVLYFLLFSQVRSKR